MPRIELVNLLKPTTTPEQEILLSFFYDYFDNRSGANKTIANVERLYFQGTLAGTEFLTYAATKMYLCYRIGVSDVGAASANVGRLLLYDETNTNNYVVSNQIMTWIGAALNYGYNEIALNNVIFSRFSVVNAYTTLVFNGYRITLS
jgi:hypothetical protein